MKHIEGILHRIYCKIRFKYGKHLAIIACPGNEPLHFHMMVVQHVNTMKTWKS